MENLENQQEPTEELEGTAVQEPNDVNQAELQKKLEELETRFKKEVSGRDRRIADMEKTMKEKEREKLSEEERIKAELEEFKAEKERLAKETENLRRQSTIEKSLYENELPIELSNRIQGSNEEEIKDDIKQFNDYVNSIVDERIKKLTNEKLAGKSPVAGTQEASTLKSAFDKAKASGNLALMTKIREEALKQGIQI